MKPVLLQNKEIENNFAFWASRMKNNTAYMTSTPKTGPSVGWWLLGYEYPVMLMH